MPAPSYPRDTSAGGTSGHPEWNKESPVSDDKSKSQGQDRQRINIHQDYELRDWSRSLGVTPDELKKAVADVGDRADNVREYFRERQGRGQKR